MKEGVNELDNVPLDNCPVILIELGWVPSRVYYLPLKKILHV
jgi:hypothetical protein